MWGADYGSCLLPPVTPDAGFSAFWPWQSIRSEDYSILCALALLSLRIDRTRKSR